MIGARLGSYEITAKLGEGGMGEVYRATDTKLHRDVAIKVLPPAFTEDKERLQRFEREAQLLAQLHHPNIASIFGLEDSGPTKALVMELVDGPTLAERLEQGALSIEESLSIARQIAEALEEAHEKGIVHRDLKPQNVKASVDGKVKVLDFGLAKAMDPMGTASGSGSVSQLAASPTLTIGATMQGVILGTASYMAPEQAKGFPVDKRADIWAFGVVLYEMLAGGTLFTGDSVGDTLAAVIRKEIDLHRLPEATPAAIRRLLRRCLERNPRNRLHSIADARIVIDEVLGGTVEEATTAAEAPKGTGRLGWILAGAGLVVGLVAGVLAGRSGTAPASAGSAATMHAEFEIPAPAATSLVSGLALSPDGTQLAFVARGEDGRPTLWVRSLGSTEARELPGTVDARYPFWAPDGRRLAFFSQNRLKVTDLLGGSPRAITETGSTEDARGGSWNADDVILFSPTFTGGLYSIPAAGGEPRLASRMAEGSGLTTQRFPSFLPDGQRFLFYASTGTGVEPGVLFLGRLGSLDAKLLGPVTSAALYAEPGYLIYVQGDSLVAHRFDSVREELVGNPLPLGISLPGSVSVSGQRSLAVSAGGILVYRTDKRAATKLVVVDREGRPLETLTSEVDTWHYTPTLSQDGRRLVVSRYEPGSTSGGLWVHDLDRGIAQRLTFETESDDTLAVWAPDDRQIAYASIRAEPPSGVFRIAVGRSAEPQAWVDRPGFVAPGAWLRDGRLVFMTFSDQGKGSIWLLQAGASGEDAVRLGSPQVSEYGADVTRDGRWLAYQSDVSRRMEVYVRPLDDASGGETFRVSADGGKQPRWRADGRELYYVDDLGMLMAVPMEGTDTLRPGKARPLFDPHLEEAADRQYDVFADGQRFLVNQRTVGDDIPISVVIGWTARLEGEARR